MNYLVFRFCYWQYYGFLKVDILYERKKFNQMNRFAKKAEKQQKLFIHLTDLGDDLDLADSEV